MRSLRAIVQHRHVLRSSVLKHRTGGRWFRLGANPEAAPHSGHKGSNIGIPRKVATTCMPAHSDCTHPAAEQDDTSSVKYCVVNFYHLVDIEDPDKLVEQHRAYLTDKNIRGRIYISAQGINAQYGGPQEQATAYAEWISKQPSFQGLKWSEWPAEGQMFPRLRLKHKPNLISLRGGMAVLPVTDPAQRAVKVSPADWKRMLAEAQVNTQNSNGGDAQPERKVVVLDVRNDYEWDAGHFQGAERPGEEEFAETPVGETHEDLPAPLRGVDKDTPVMMYCTGGIRCDVYSTFLRKQGFNKMYTLEGGIQNYLRQEGQDFWKGSLFVFDGRMAMQPAAGDQPTENLQAAVPCQLCGAPAAELPHMNCANIDCNELFIACRACKDKWKGCCCDACMRAPRLVRPIKIEGGHYGGWGNYADPDLLHPVISTGRASEGRLARRQRRREAQKVKRQAQLEERYARRQLVKEMRDQLERQAAAVSADEQPHAKATATVGTGGPDERQSQQSHNSVAVSMPDLGSLSLAEHR